MSPAARLGQVAEVAAVVCFLAGPKASCVNGAVVRWTGRSWADDEGRPVPIAVTAPFDWPWPRLQSRRTSAKTQMSSRTWPYIRRKPASLA